MPARVLLPHPQPRKILRTFDLSLFYAVKQNPNHGIYYETNSVH